jgi:hypothetical protein
VIRVRRAISDTLVSVAALTVLLVVLVSVNDRVRQQVSTRLSDSHPRQELAHFAANARDLGSVVVGAARRQSIEHAPVVIFVLAACVLVGFMLRI